jgi:hypothetical protein
MTGAGRETRTCAMDIVDTNTGNSSCTVDDTRSLDPYLYR